MSKNRRPRNLFGTVTAFSRQLSKFRWQIAFEDNFVIHLYGGGEPGLLFVKALFKKANRFAESTLHPGEGQHTRQENCTAH